MRYFVFTDAHGHFNALKASLESKGFDSSDNEHILISCGDNFDRGVENYEMFNFLKGFIDSNRIVLIKGNHDTFLERIISRGFVSPSDYTTTVETLENFKEKLNLIDLQDVVLWMKENMKSYFDNLKWYYELGDFIFTHSWLPLKYHDSPNYVWNEATMIEGQYQYTKNEIIPNKTLVNGHRFSFFYHFRFKSPGACIDDFCDIPLEYFKPYYDKGIIALDTCTIHTKRVNILVIDEENGKYVINKQLSD